MMITQTRMHWLVVVLVSALFLHGCVPVAPAAAPAAVYAPISQAAKAYFDYINDTEGGVYGRKITFLIEDDGYSPPKLSSWCAN